MSKTTKTVLVVERCLVGKDGKRCTKKEFSSSFEAERYVGVVVAQWDGVQTLSVSIERYEVPLKSRDRYHILCADTSGSGVETTILFGHYRSRDAALKRLESFVREEIDRRPDYGFISRNDSIVITHNGVPIKSLGIIKINDPADQGMSVVGCSSLVTRLLGTQL